MAKVIVFGLGSMARNLNGYAAGDVHAFTSHAFAGIYDTFCGKPLVEFGKLESRFPPDRYSMIVAFGYQEMNDARRKVAIAAQFKGYKLSSFFGNGIVAAIDSEMGNHCLIYDNVSVQSGAKVRDGTFIAPQVSIGHDCVVEPYSWINSGVCLGGGVVVGEQSVLGMNCTVAHGVKLGRKTYVGANTLVTRDTKDGEVVISPRGVTHRLNSDEFMKSRGGI